jgi:hypothetical protein
MDGHTIRMSLQRFDHTKLVLLNRGFYWIQECPFVLRIELPADRPAVNLSR